jgi:IPT/TIG domain/Bacterial Ig-like domain
MSPGVTFSGRLFGEGGVALADATIGVGQEHVTTAADGSFSLSVAPGTYRFEVGGYRQSGVSAGAVPYYFSFYGGEISLSSSLSENITLPLHAVTVKTVGPGGSPIPGVKFTGELSERYLGSTQTLAPGITAQYGYTSENETTNANGEAVLSVADVERPNSTMEAVPPTETQLARVPVNLAKISEDQTRLVAFGKSGTDTTPPEIKCEAPSEGWHGENVTLRCAASDSGTGLAHPEDSSFTLSTSTNAGEETATAYTGTHRVCDKADNCAEAGPVGPIEVDRKPPSIVISSPAEGTRVEQGSLLKLEFSCSDAGSGVATCQGSAADGSTLSTSSVGLHSVSVSAADNVGNEATVTRTYEVVPAAGPPSVFCEEPTGVWHPGNVSVRCTASDVAGFNTPSEESFMLSTAVGEGEETGSAYTGAREVCAKNGLCSTAGPVGPFRIDRKAPSITVSSPEEGEVIVQGAAVDAGYSCADGGSGVASCEGTIPAGAPLATAALGEHTLGVSASDEVGNRSSRTVHYVVVARGECPWAAAVCQDGPGATPELQGVEIHPSSVNTSNRAQAVTVELQAGDTPAGLAAVQVSLSSGSRWYSASAHLVSGSVLEGMWVATVTLPRYTPKGVYGLSVGLLDYAENHRTYAQPRLEALGFPATVTQEGEVPAGFPSITGVAVSPSSVATCGSAQAVTVHVHGADSLGITQVQATLTSPAGQQVSAGASLESGSEQDGVWTAHVTLPEGATKGDWKLSVYVVDQAGNSLFLSPGQLAEAGDESQIEQSCEPSPAERTPPEVTAVTMTPESTSTAASAQAITVTVRATDSHSPVSYLDATLTDESQSHSASAALQAGENPADGVWRAQITLPRWSLTGTWQLTLHAGDEAGDSTTLSPSQLASLGLPYSIVQTGEDDTIAPELTSCSIDPAAINTSHGPATVHVHLHTTDTQSGTAGTLASFTAPGGHQLSSPGKLTSGTDAEGEWTSTITFPEGSEQGAWRLALELFDAIGNRRTLTSSELEKHKPALCQPIENTKHPVVEHVDPGFGSVRGGEQVTITGLNLEGAEQVHFGSTKAEHFEVVSNTELRVITPVHSDSEESVPVAVITPNGTSAENEHATFEYIAEVVPVLKGVSSNRGPASGGSIVKITGENLQGATAVHFGTNPAAFTRVSHTEVTATVPTGAAEAVYITVTTVNGTTPLTKKVRYKYQGPIITAITPNTGPQAGGSTITITGYGFNPGHNTTSFHFGKTTAPETNCESNTTCTTTTPSAKKPGPVQVTATTGKAKSKKNPPNTQYTYQ